MSRPTVREYNSQTNEFVDREMNDQEFSDYELAQLDYEAQKSQAEEKAQAKAQLLAQLGITEEQAKLLLS